MTAPSVRQIALALTLFWVLAGFAVGRLVGAW